MRLKPDGAREFHNYLHVVITLDEEDQRRPGDKRRYFNLGFYTFLEHDFQDDDKCAICLRRYKRLEIDQVIKETG